MSLQIALSLRISFEHVPVLIYVTGLVEGKPILGELAKPAQQVPPPRGMSKMSIYLSI